MSINNREDANKYYQVVNSLVDDYIEKWKIRPSNLKKYLNPGSDRFNKFLERNGLKDIKGVQKVLKDVLEDRESMEEDGVITFENFKFFESTEFKLASLKQCLYKGIEKASNMHEKAIADAFDTSLGHIDIVDSDKHKFIVDTWGNNKIDVIVYTKEEVELISENMIEYLVSEAKSKEVVISDGITIKLENIISDDNLKSQLRDNYFSDKSNLISKCLESYEFYKEFDKYFIWTKRD